MLLYLWYLPFLNLLATFTSMSTRWWAKRDNSSNFLSYSSRVVEPWTICANLVYFSSQWVCGKYLVRNNSLNLALPIGSWPTFWALFVVSHQCLAPFFSMNIVHTIFSSLEGLKNSNMCSRSICLIHSSTSSGLVESSKEGGESFLKSAM